jgi:hypothetical protein
MTTDFGAGVNFTSRFSTVLGDFPGFYQGGYAKFDANAALRGKDDKWSVSLSGLNLTNRFTTASCANDNARNATIFGGQIAGGPVGGPAGGDVAVCSVDRGREVWARASYRF